MSLLKQIEESISVHSKLHGIFSPEHTPDEYHYQSHVVPNVTKFLTITQQIY